MDMIRKKLDGIYELVCDHYEDNRGCLVKTYDKDFLDRLNLDSLFIRGYIQESIKKNTVRGLHFQLPPYTETKIIFPIQGEVK